MVHILDTAITLLSQVSLPSSFWFHAIAIAIYLINRMPTPLLNNESPFELLFSSKPSLTHLRVFGHACLWSNLSIPLNLHLKHFNAFFLDTSLIIRGIYVTNPSTKKFHISRHIHFDETIFLSVHAPPPSFPSNLTSSSSQSSISAPILTPLIPFSPPFPSSNSIPSSSPTLSRIDPSPSIAPPSSPSSSPSPSSISSSSTESSTSTSPRPFIHPNNIHPMQTHAKDGIVKHRVFLAATTTSTPDLSLEPSSYTTTSKSPIWRNTMDEKYAALMHQHTWTHSSTVRQTCHWLQVGLSDQALFKQLHCTQ